MTLNMCGIAPNSLTVFSGANRLSGGRCGRKMCSATVSTSARFVWITTILLTAGSSFASEGAAGRDRSALSGDGGTRPKVGCGGDVGCLANPKRARRLNISKAGTYQNYRIDGGWSDSNLVKIQGDHVTLKNCEVFNGRHNGVVVYANDVVIDSCKIHHLLKGTFKDQKDAHGISGRPNRLTIRNCEIYLTSGDSVQFDPGRGKWSDVTIENCTFWTAPLVSSAAGFRRGERPGENAVDTKASKSNPRSRMTIRNSLFWGWQQGQIKNQAALNLKENVSVTIEGCVFRYNDICFRLRGDVANRGGATVRIKDCAIYSSLVGVRMEDKIRDLRIHGLAVGDGVKKTYQVAGGIGTGYVNSGQQVAPPYKEAIARGVATAKGTNSEAKKQ